MNRQKLVLSVLLALLAISLVYSFWRTPRQKTVSKLTYAPGVAALKPVTSSQKVFDDKKVHLDLLNRPTVQFSGFRKNIFQPLFQEKRIVHARPSTRTAKPSSLPVPSQAIPLPQPSPVKEIWHSSPFSFSEKITGKPYSSPATMKYFWSKRETA
jgi:hypothetical protein